jgi:hypothetical protein
MTDKGMTKMNERSSNCKFWETTDRAVVMTSHQNAPEVKLDDFTKALDDSRFTNGLSPIPIVFTPTVIRVARQFTESGVDGSWSDPFKIVPCGWPW